jgi:hypothetical protein
MRRTFRCSRGAGFVFFVTVAFFDVPSRHGPLGNFRRSQSFAFAAVSLPASVDDYCSVVGEASPTRRVRNRARGSSRGVCLQRRGRRDRVAFRSRAPFGDRVPLLRGFDPGSSATKHTCGAYRTVVGILWRSLRWLVSSCTFLFCFVLSSNI